MKHFLRAVVLWFFAAVLSIPAVSQSRPLSPRGAKLSEALQQLKDKPNDKAAREHYLAVFPKTFKAFCALFDLDRELADGNEYVDALVAVGRENPAEVGRLLVQLSKDAHYEADAQSYLQNATATFGAEHTAMFLKFARQLHPKQLSNLITFLADVENHSAYPEYQAIIDHSKNLGDSDFAARLETARSDRIRQPHR